MGKAKKKTSSKKTPKAKKTAKKAKKTKRAKKAKKVRKIKKTIKKAKKKKVEIPEETELEDEVEVHVEDIEASIDELVREGLKKIKIDWIGPRYLTKYERSRIIGARALQISMSAPILVSEIPPYVKKEPISIAEYELKLKILPLTIRRTTPDGICKDIPLRAFEDRPEDINV
ncbi:MAG: DNA-directed RNA polymerase subunit K [Candidatus Helarchaeota archaeon]